MPSTPTVFDTDTKLMLHGDSGNTTLTDSSSVPKSVTARGSCTSDTGQSKFGGASIKFPTATTDYFDTPNSADFDFGTGDFTFDCWIRFTTLPSSGTYLFGRGGGPSFALRYTSGNLDLYLGGGVPLSNAWSPSTNTWYHFAVTRNGTNLRYFIDGTQLGGTATNSTNITDSATFSMPTTSGAGNGYAGFADEIRSVKGTAVWTANFTPPSAAYSLPSNLIAIGRNVMRGVARGVGIR